MPKRTITLVVVLTFLTGLLVFLAVQNERRLQTQQDDVVKPSPVVLQQEKTAKLTFTPSEVVVAASGSSQTVDLVLDTKQYEVDGVQVELIYDPAVLSNVKIIDPTEGAFAQNFSSALLNSVDPNLGRVSYWYGRKLDAPATKGVGTVAQLSFTVNPQASASETMIEILDRSMVTEPEMSENVLGITVPLKIVIPR